MLTLLPRFLRSGPSSAAGGSWYCARLLLIVRFLRVWVGVHKLRMANVREMRTLPPRASPNTSNEQKKTTRRTERRSPISNTRGWNAENDDSTRREFLQQVGRTASASGMAAAAHCRHFVHLRRKQSLPPSKEQRQSAHPRQDADSRRPGNRLLDGHSWNYARSCRRERQGGTAQQSRRGPTN